MQVFSSTLRDAQNGVALAALKAIALDQSALPSGGPPGLNAACPLTLACIIRRHPPHSLS